MIQDADKFFLLRAIQLSEIGMNQEKGGPFGAVIVKQGQIIGQGFNEVTSTNDPTAHGEMVAIRNACKKLGNFSLEGCTIYTSCQPCLMCLGAINWSNAKRFVYSNTLEDASEIGFGQLVYDFVPDKTFKKDLVYEHRPLAEALAVFKKWHQKANKTTY